MPLSVYDARALVLPFAVVKELIVAILGHDLPFGKVRVQSSPDPWPRHDPGPWRGGAAGTEAAPKAQDPLNPKGYGSRSPAPAH